jgi:pantoate--beta-alanine ligase
MKILKTKSDLELIIREKKLALVPTMGALHDGHLSLVRLAHECSDEVIVSIFVNPTQFGPNEDLDKYPRPIETDINKLKDLKVDYLFLPDEKILYPNGREITHYANDDLSNALCGLNRPGHFDGVCTVVYKLFDLIKPDLAVFGEKDYQQLLIIKDMVRVENLVVEIIAAPILRESDGLAMSSRNLYLNKEQRLFAAELNRCLRQIVSGEKYIHEAYYYLESLGFEMDYLEEKWNRVFIAAKIGSTRLIDNIAFSSKHFS